MRDALERIELLGEALERHALVHALAEDLERHLLVPPVLGDVDHAHPAVPDSSQDRVFAEPLSNHGPIVPNLCAGWGSRGALSESL